jgi:hypothetical protein
VAEWTPFRTHYFLENLIVPGNRTRGLWICSQEPLDHRMSEIKRPEVWNEKQIPSADSSVREPHCQLGPTCSRRWQSSVRGMLKRLRCPTRQHGNTYASPSGLQKHEMAEPEGSTFPHAYESNIFLTAHGLWTCTRMYSYGVLTRLHGWQHLFETEYPHGYKCDFIPCPNENCGKEVMVWKE